jgi:ABC-type transport system involved in multi-copper enzyme maturation permease subunit
MAVYKRHYEPFRGRLTRRWSRSFVLTRFAFRELFASRFFFAFFIACLIPVLGFAGYIFVANSSLVHTLLAMVSSKFTIHIEKGFFTTFLQVQSSFAFLLTCWACPTLVAGDLSNGALPLFLSRPFSRAEYVVGKFAVLAVLLSFLTWIPALGLLFLEAGLSSSPWFGAHRWMIGPILWSSLVWIVLLSLVALATSAWVKWRIVAMAAIFAVFLIPAGFGAVLNGILQTHWGRLLDLTFLFHQILYAGFRTPLAAGEGAIPQSAAWGMMALACVVSLEMLGVRLRAFEVVRG